MCSTCSHFINCGQMMESNHSPPSTRRGRRSTHRGSTCPHRFLQRMWIGDGIEPLHIAIGNAAFSIHHGSTHPHLITKMLQLTQVACREQTGLLSQLERKYAEWVGLEAHISSSGFSLGLLATKPATIILHTQTCFTMQI